MNVLALRVAAVAFGLALSVPSWAQEYRLSEHTDAAALTAADAQFQAGQFGEAMRGYRVLLDRAGDGPDALVLAVRFGIAANRAGDFQAARSVLNRQIASGRWEQQDPDLRDRALEEGTDASSRSGQPKEALSHARRLVELRAKVQGEEAPATQAARLTIATMLDEPATYEEAKQIRDEALAILKKGDPNLYVRILNNFVNVVQKKGRLDSAAELYDLLLAELRSRPESVDLGIIELNKALLDRSRYDIDSAIEHNRRAIDVLERLEGKASANVVAAIGSLGTTYSHAGRPAAALPLLQDAYQRAVSNLGPTNDTMDIASNLSGLLRGFNRHAEAEPLDRTALKWFSENYGPAAEQTLHARRNLAYDLFGMGRSKEAKQELDRVLETLQQTRGEDDPLTIDFKRDAEIVAVLTGTAAASDATLVQLFDDTPATAENMLLANRMAGVADKKGDRAAEMRLHRLALKLSEEVYGEFHQQTLTMLANVARADRSNDATTTTATYAELERRMRLWSRREFASTSDQVLLEQVALWTRESIGDILAYSYKARTDPQARQLFATVLAEWKAVGSLERAVMETAKTQMSEPDKTLMAKVTRLREQSLARPGAGMDDVERELAIAEAALSDRVTALRQGNDSESYAAVASRLQPDEAIVDYMIAPVRMKSGFVERVFAMVSRAGGRSSLHDLGRLSEVAGPLLDRGTGYGEAMRRSLYDTLIRKLEPELEGARRLHIVPDGVLNLAPFDGLLDEAGRNLIETRDVRIARNARSVSSGRDLAVEPGRVLLVGDVDYGAGSDFAALPYTRVEVANIAKTMTSAAFKPAVIEGSSADEASVRTAAAGSRIVHFATHGFFQPVSATESAPLWRAGVALAGANAAPAAKHGDDGILYAAELTGWPLAGVELVVLSACDTAQGDRSYVEGLSGLPSALAAAGAKRSLLARWPVNDEGAANFMARFYENLAVKRGYASALRQTKLDAIAGAIAGVTDDTWLAFALIENERSQTAEAGEPTVEEAVAHQAKGEPDSQTEMPSACGSPERGAVPC